MGLESFVARARNLEDPIRRKEAREIQALLENRGPKECLEHIKAGEMVRVESRLVSSFDTYGGYDDHSGSSRQRPYSDTMHSLFFGDALISRGDSAKLPARIERLARLAGRDTLYLRGAEDAAKKLAAESVPIRLAVWARNASSSATMLFDETGPADVVFARAARMVPDKATLQKSTYSYALTPVTLPEDSKQNRSELEGVLRKKSGQYTKQHLAAMFAKLQNPPDDLLLRIVGNRQHLIAPPLEKIKQDEAARVHKRHPELFEE
jgi:hypothetical protein